MNFLKKKEYIFELLIFFFIILISILFFGKGLRINGTSMFLTHDSTQIARIDQFILNLKNFKFPPRIAPEMSFRMGWPLFNLYAPTSYWIASGVNFMTRFSIVNTLRMTYLLAIICGFVGSYLFFRLFFKQTPSLLGAILYGSSTYISIDIFIRGALAETWFIALFPFIFYCITILGRKEKVSPLQSYLLFPIIICLFIGAHNTLSFIGLAVAILYILFQKQKMRPLISLILGLLLATSYWLPLIYENIYTQVYKLSLAQNPIAHLLCVGQLWDSPWGYGLSLEGCNDGMPFKVGKPQLIIFSIAIFLFIIQGLRDKSKLPEKLQTGFFIFVGLFFLFLSTYLSKPLWVLFKNQLALIQFPWRLIGVSLIGIGFMGTWVTNQLFVSFKKIKLIPVFIIIFVISIAYYQSRTFVNDQVTATTASYEKQFSQKNKIIVGASYGYNELIPASVDFSEYMRFNPYSNTRLLPTFFDSKKLDIIQNGISSGPVKMIINTPFERSATFIANENIAYVNIHAYPNWILTINNKKINSYDFLFLKQTDAMGRPIIHTTPGQSYFVSLQYKQTQLEVWANIITCITLIACIFLAIRTHLSKRTNCD